MTDMSAIGRSRGRRGRASADPPSRPGRLARSCAREAVTIISAPASSRKDVAAARVGRPARPGPPDRPHVRTAGPARRTAVLARAAGAVRAATGGAEPLPAAPEFNGQAMVDKVLSELAAASGLFVLITDDLHEPSAGYGENARTGVKDHLDTVTERGRAHHREIHPVLADAHIEVFITTTMFAAGHRSFLVLKAPAAGLGVTRRSPVRRVPARQRTRATPALPVLCRAAGPIFWSRGRHPSHQHDPASVTCAVATQIIPICVIGAGCDEVGEAVQNGGSGRVLALRLAAIAAGSYGSSATMTIRL
jgi:hypothetical protein